jgi:hypothetical protein
MPNDFKLFILLFDSQAPCCRLHASRHCPECEIAKDRNAAARQVALQFSQVRIVNAANCVH